MDFTPASNKWVKTKGTNYRCTVCLSLIVLCCFKKKHFCASYFWQYGNTYTLFSNLRKIKLIKLLISLDITVSPQSGTHHVQSDIMYCFPHILLNVLFYEVKISKYTCYHIPATWYIFTVAGKYFLGYSSCILLQTTLAPLGIPSSILLIDSSVVMSSLKRAWKGLGVWAECDTLLGKEVEAMKAIFFCDTLTKIHHHQQFVPLEQTLFLSGFLVTVLLSRC